MLRKQGIYAVLLVSFLLPVRTLARGPAVQLRAVDPVVAASPFSDPAPYVVRAPSAPLRRHGPAFGSARYALLLSIDGVPYDLLVRYLQRLPNLRKLARAGFVRPVQSVFPSMTWPAHVSLATGQYPRHHGVIANLWFEDFRRLVLPYQHSVVEPDRFHRTPALYDLAAARGWVTAALNWPATQEARNLTYNLPEVMYSTRYTYRYLSPRLRDIVDGMYNKLASREGPSIDVPELVGRIATREDLQSDKLVRDLVVRLVAPAGGQSQQRIPRLLLAHFVTADTMMHGRGRSTRLLLRALQEIDDLVGDVLAAYGRAGITQQTAFFVVSDHGFVDIRRAIDLRLLLKRAGYSKYRRLRRARQIRHEKIVASINTQVAYVYVRHSERHRIPALIATLKAPAHARCIEAVYRPEAYRKLGLPGPKRRSGIWSGEHAGAPALVVLARSDCIFRNGGSKVIRPYRPRHAARFGSHGYLPVYRKLRAFAIGAGPGIRARGELTRCKVVDIAPTIAHVLGLSWPTKWPAFGKRPFKLDGRVLADVLSR